MQGGTWLPVKSVGDGDVDAVLADCDEVLEHAYHMRSFNQAMMETFVPIPSWIDTEDCM